MILRLHGLAGICVGAILVLVGLTGSVLVFREEIEAFLYPDLWRVVAHGQTLPLEPLIAELEQAHPNDRIFAIRMPVSADGVLVVWLNDEHGLRIHLDPYTGRLLGTRYPGQTVTGFLFLLHTGLLAGETGETINGLAALSLLALVSTGAVLWWPGVRHLRSGVTIRCWNRTAMTYDLHKVTGMAAAVVLLVISISGAALVFYSSFQYILTILTLGRVHQTAPHSLPRSEPRASLDLVLQTADAALPGAITTWIIVPAAPDGTVTVRKRFPEEWHPNGRSFVWLDQYNGHVLAVDNALRASRGKQIDNVLYPLHIGRFGGIGSQVLYLVAGFVPTILFITGWWMWNHKQKWRPKFTQ